MINDNRINMKYLDFITSDITESIINGFPNSFIIADSHSTKVLDIILSSIMEKASEKIIPVYLSYNVLVQSIGKKFTLYKILSFIINNYFSSSINPGKLVNGSKTDYLWCFLNNQLVDQKKRMVLLVDDIINVLETLDYHDRASLRRNLQDCSSNLQCLIGTTTAKARKNTDVFKYSEPLYGQFCFFNCLER